MERQLTIRDLYPDATEEQLQEAEENLNEYMLLVLRIYERICSEPESYERFRAALTKPAKDIK